MTTVVGILAAILSFGFIVFIHEMGHFLTARWAGIHCPQFAIGFGPRLAAFCYQGTEFSLRLFPLGGYVLMDGEDPNQEAENSWSQLFGQTVGELSFPTTPARVLENLAEANPEVETFLRSLPPHRLYHTMGDLAGNFHAKSTWQKTVVILGGVTMNFVAAWLLLVGLGLTVGLGVIEDNILPRVAEVLPEGAAARVGLPKDATLHAVDGQPVVSGTDFTSQLRNRVGESVRLQFTPKGSSARQVEVVTDLSLAERYSLRQTDTGVELFRCAEGALPEGARLPWPVKTVNGKPLHTLQELKTWAQAAKELTLRGPQGEWKLTSESTGLNPRGVVGIVLASVTSFGFEKKATNLVLEVLPDSQAARAGVQAGDKLVDLQGVQVLGGQTQLDQCLARLTQRPLPEGESLRLRVIRGAEVKVLYLDEAPYANTDAFGLRLEPVTATLVVKHSSEVVGMIMRVPYVIFRGLVTNLVGTWSDLKKGTTGPIGIMQQIFEVSDEGLPELLFLVAILNAFIATFNLLPIPALDGSRLMFIWIGALRGRPVDPDKEARIHFLGIVVLLCIVLLVSIQDVRRLVDGASILK